MRRLAGVRAVFREPHFARLYATRLTSQAGDGVFQTALAGFVLFSPERQADAGAMAVAFATLLLPYSVVAPFAGVFIDRWSRQRILVVANVVRAGLVAVVAGLVAGGESGSVFFAGALCVVGVNRFFLSSLSAALPHVVAPERLVLANALSTTSGALATVAGGGIGLGVRALAGDDDTGAATVAIGAVVAYLVSSLVAGRIGRRLLGPDHDPERPATTDALRRVGRGLADGARHVWERREAGRALVAIGAHRFFFGLSTVSTFLLYRNYFTDDGVLKAGLAGLIQLVVASACGVFVAAAVTPTMARRIGAERWVVLCYAGAAVTEVAFGFPYTLGSFLVAGFLLGLAAQASKICVDSIVQLSVEDDYRGRVFSFYDVLFNVAFVAAAGFGVLVLPASGKSHAVLGLIAIGYAATAFGYAAATRDARTRELVSQAAG